MTNPTWEIVAATGHRPKDLDSRQRRWVRATMPGVIARLRDDHGMRTAVSGMALFADMLFAAEAKKAGLFLWAHIPFPQQPAPWSLEDQAEWARLRALADDEVVYGDHFHLDFYGDRNIGMLDVSQALVAVHLPSKRTGGTWRTMRDARRREMPVVHLDPERELVIWPDPPRSRELGTQLDLFGGQP